MPDECKDDNEDGPTPPSPLRVARRAMAIAAVASRCFTDEIPDYGPAQRESLQLWVDYYDLRAELTAWESAMLAAPIGGIAEQDLRNGQWLSEGLVVLAWALQRCEMPSVGVKIDPYDICCAIGLQEPMEETILHLPSLRPHGDIERFASHMMDVHWRVRSHRTRQKIDFQSHKLPFEQLGLTLCEGDLAIEGIPIFECDESAISSFRSVVIERHRAVNWLEGWEPNFYEVATDT